MPNTSLIVCPRCHKEVSSELQSCPNCHEDLNGLPQNNALTCKTCNNRVLVKSNKFYKMI